VKRYDINLSSKPFHNNTLHWIAFGLIFLGLSAFTWHDIRAFRSSGTEEDSWADALDARRSDLAKLTDDTNAINTQVARMDLEFLHDRSSFANQIILSRLFSWSKLFDRLEAIQPELVRIRSIRPSISSTSVDITLDGATKNAHSLIDFEEALLKSEHFALVYPVMETSRQKREEIEFTVSFQYLPEGKKPQGESITPIVNLDDIFQKEGDEEGEAPAEGQPAPPGQGIEPGAPAAGDGAQDGGGAQDSGAGTQDDGADAQDDGGGGGR